MLLHVAHAPRQENEMIVVCSVDTDVVVLAVAANYFGWCWAVAGFWYRNKVPLLGSTRTCHQSWTRQVTCSNVSCTDYMWYQPCYQPCTKKKCSEEKTRAALEQHVKRVVYQEGHVWGQVLFHQHTLPSPTRWGWVRSDDNQYQPFGPSFQSYELISCGCKDDCNNRCKCKSADLKC